MDYVAASRVCEAQIYVLSHIMPIIMAVYLWSVFIRQRLFIEICYVTISVVVVMSISRNFTKVIAINVTKKKTANQRVFEVAITARERANKILISGKSFLLPVVPAVDLVGCD